MSTIADLTPIWGIIPAAGIGSRMQSEIPKQYLKLNNKTILEHSLKRLLSVDKVTGVIIALNPDDIYWKKLSIQSDKPVHTTEGGSERCESVLNALEYLSSMPDFNEQCNVLVHDAVRPCVRSEDIQNLIYKTGQSEAGGLLALHVRDTMKEQDSEQRVNKTVEREPLWHALTPQYFPWKALHMALSQALDKGLQVTDESSAMELAGYKPLLVEGDADNIKITRPADLKLAEFLLRSN